MDVNLNFIDELNKLKKNKFLYFELKKIKGLNHFSIIKIFNILNLSFNILVVDLEKDKTKYIFFLSILKKFLIDIKVTIKFGLNIDKKKIIYNYQGYRHILNLPCRGQGTKRNGKTKKKKKK